MGQTDRQTDGRTEVYLRVVWLQLKAKPFMYQLVKPSESEKELKFNYVTGVINLRTYLNLSGLAHTHTHCWRQTNCQHGQEDEICIHSYQVMNR